MIGAARRRVEDGRFLTGGACFIDDLPPRGELHCALVRSPHAHARIASIAVPSGIVAFTGKDLAGVNPMRAGWELPGMVQPPRYPLARDTVRHVGEPVAAVFAESRALAEDAAERVAVEYQPLPLLGDEVCFRWQRGDAAAVAAQFTAARHVVSLDLANNRLCGAAIEGRGMLATGDTLYCATQAPHHIRHYVCAELGLPESALRVVSPDMGGGFGYKGKHYPEETLLVWAARRLGRPVRWIAGRRESFLSDTQGRDHVTHAELALDGEGHFLAVRVATRANLGAYVSTFGAAIPGPIYSALLAGVYRTPAVYVEVTGVFSNTLPTDAYRGAGRRRSAAATSSRARRCRTRRPSGRPTIAAISRPFSRKRCRLPGTGRSALPHPGGCGASAWPAMSNPPGWRRRAWPACWARRAASTRPPRCASRPTAASRRSSAPTTTAKGTPPLLPR
jgi:carbon-monoxide dehydrogenase large subunit